MQQKHFCEYESGELVLYFSNILVKTWSYGLKIWRNIEIKYLFHFNPFVPNVPFLYPLKTLENLMVFWCFRGVKKGCIGNVCVKAYFYVYDRFHTSCLKAFNRSHCKWFSYFSLMKDRGAFVLSGWIVYCSARNLCEA